MVTSKIAICPICGKRTFLRIEDGSYLYKYPIRIHCLNCRALLEGVYIMDSSVGPMGLTMFNAITEDPYYHQESDREIDADYIAEVSGELPCIRPSVFDGKIPIETPFLRAVDHIEVLDRLEQLRSFLPKMEEWSHWKSIAFHLLSENALEYLPSALHNKMGEYNYECSNYLKSLHCLQEVVREETSTLFTSPDQDKTVLSLLSLVSNIDNILLHQFVLRYGGIEKIKSAYRKTIDIFSYFMQVYQYLLPAETYNYYKSRDSQDLIISTCTFDDIKYFYQDAYETLLSLVLIPVCLDNILTRGDYQNYHPAYTDFYNNKDKRIKDKYRLYSDDYERYINLDNGKKAELLLKSCEHLQSIIDIPVNRGLRNAISHSTYKYDGLTEIITIFDQKNPSRIKFTISLMEMAIDCIRLAKSTELFAELLLFILRREDTEYHSIMHPRYYRNTERNEKCPCGSGKKYKKCCMNELDSLLR